VPIDTSTEDRYPYNLSIFSSRLTIIVPHSCGRQYQYQLGTTSFTPKLFLWTTAELSVSVDNKLILYVDDHRDSISFMSAWLELQGYEVKTAGSCAEAWAVWGSGQVDLLILDARLPDGSGFDLCKALLAKSSATPVIIVSGDTRPEVQKEAESAGAKAFVGKPIDFDEVAALITKFVG
jgi:CheY-like chemotaxis protein